MKSGYEYQDAHDGSGIRRLASVWNTEFFPATNLELLTKFCPLYNLLWPCP